MKTWMIEDASQTAKENPTTFYIPPSEDIKSLSPGKMVKLIFNPVDHEKYFTERMWVVIETVNDGIFTGRLMNVPAMQGLEYGDPIEFEEKNIIDIVPDGLERDTQLRSCTVSKSILEDGEKPHHILWITPKYYIDSGWLILSGRDEDYIDQDNSLITIPLFAILDHDDSFKHLLFLEKETSYFWYEESQSWVEFEDY